MYVVTYPDYRHGVPVPASKVLQQPPSQELQCTQVQLYFPEVSNGEPSATEGAHGLQQVPQLVQIKYTSPNAHVEPVDLGSLETFPEKKKCSRRDQS